MHFWKYCGAGNDFVILENFDGSIAPERYAALAAALCREQFLCASLPEEPHDVKVRRIVTERRTIRSDGAEYEK